MASFDNHRRMALPCENMYGCVFCDTFITSAISAENNATFTGSPTVDNGVTLDGSTQYATHTIKSSVFDSTNISIVVVFYPDFATTENQTRYIIDAETGKRYALAKMDNSYNNTIAVMLGNTNVAHVPEATYSPYWTVGTRTVLTVSGTSANTNAWMGNTTASGQILTADNTAWTKSDPVTVYTGCRYAIDGFFDGKIESIRVFNTLLTETDHDHYVNEDLTSFATSPYASWRCNDFGDDTDVNKIWDRSINKRDLTKGDGSTAGTFPTFVPRSGPVRAYYSFDGSNDYIDDMPTLPATYTFTAAKSTASTNPSVEQDNDDTFHSDLTTSGTYTGFIHGMVLHSGVLTPMQLLHDKYNHLYNLWIGEANRAAYGAYARLMTEGVCILAEFLDSSNPYDDEVSGDTGTDTLVTADGANGCTFASATSNVQFADSADRRSDEITIHVSGVFDGTGAGTLVDKGTNYNFYTDYSGGNHILYLNSSYLDLGFAFDNNAQVAVSAKDGKKPRFFVDGEYQGEGDANVTLDDTDTTVVNIGNNNAKNDNTPETIKQVGIFNNALTDIEVKALYQQSVWINNQY